MRVPPIDRRTLLELMHLPDGKFEFGEVRQLPGQGWTVEVFTEGTVPNNIQVNVLRRYVDQVHETDAELAARVDKVIDTWRELRTPC